MQNFGVNMNQGTLSPASSSMSGSSVRSSNEFHQQQLKSRLVTENASMDYSMRSLQLKMQSKEEELKNLMEEKASNTASLENLKKQMTLLQDRESSLAIAITRIRDNSIVSEGLESAVIQNLKAFKISNEEQKSKWDTMIKEYTAIMNAHKEIYSSLPWVKEKEMLAVQVEKKRIFLERLKLQDEENKSKQSYLEKISAEKMKMEIIKLSKLMVGRNSELIKSEELDSYQKTLVQGIEIIERQKKDIEDDITMRTQEMMRRIVDRSNIKEKITPLEKTKEQKITPSISSIRDRLGISKKKEESKGMLAAASLRDRLAAYKILSPRSSPNDSYQPPSSSRPDMDAEVSSPSSEIDETGSLQADDMPCSPPAVDDESREFHSEAAVESRSESEAAPAVLMSSPAQRREPLSAVSLPEVTVTSSQLGRPVPLKAILRPPASLKMPVGASQTVVSSFARGLPQTQTIEFSSAPTVTAFTSQPQATDGELESPLEVSGYEELVGPSSQQSFKRSTEYPKLPEPAEGQSEPKKTKLETAMPPPPKAALTRRPPKPKKAAAASGSSQQQKMVKRVSFVNGSQTHLGGSSQSSNEGSQGTTTLSEPGHAMESTPTPSQPVHQETTSGQTQKATNQPTSSDEGIAQPSPQSVPVSAADQPSPSASDDFPPPFSSPPPPPFTGTNALQGTSGNFDSIFGAIFSSSPTPNDSMGFQFPLGGDAQKQDSNQVQPQPAAPPPPGQDFFSFFGTPSSENSKKSSFTDNFFKLF